MTIPDRSTPISLRFMPRTMCRLALAIVVLVLAVPACGPRVDDQAVRAALKKQLGRGVRLFRRPTMDVDDIQPLARRFYRERGYRPAWVSSRGPKSGARELLKAIQEAPREGLDPRLYDPERLQQTIEKVDPGLIGPAPEAKELAALDLLLTRTFLRYASHLASGQVDPRQLPADWHLPRRKVDLGGTLKQVVESHHVRAALEDLPPRDPRYAALRDALARYREIAERGGWKPIPPGKTLRPGQRGARVAALRERLVASGDLDSASPAHPVFDRATQTAVQRFQARHGLEPDGIVGADDLAALNEPVERRIRTLELNMERWRWVNLPLGDRYIVVNIPGFSLNVIEGSRSVMNMRVVVGKAYSRTPLFSDEITYLVLNPYWNVPTSIAGAEVLAAAQKDPSYLSRQNILVYEEGDGEDARPIEPSSVDWSNYSADHLPFQFRQEPGPDNPVGKIKFMCPNQFDVYLHDTPAGHLFSESERDFSHGCVRLEKPLALAEYVLEGKEDAAAITAAIATSRDSIVRLPHPIPVHLLYWTAWVDGQGAVQFRDDIYDLDQVLGRAIERARPAARPKKSATT